MSFGKFFFYLFGLACGILIHNFQIPKINEILYLLIGALGGYFLFNFFPYYFHVESTENTSSASPAVTEVAPAEIYVKKLFKASIFGDPLTPDEIIFDKKGITFNVKELFGNTETFVLYSDISGVEIVEGVLLCTIKIKPKTRNTDIKIDNFGKADAKIIKKLILEKL